MDEASADGDPAEEGSKEFSEVGRCNEGAWKGQPRSAFEGVDLESESQ
jgi:hypothetical protein